jgi:hypothetical protein
MTVPTISLMQDVVRVASSVIYRGGKVAVHCHAVRRRRRRRRMIEVVITMMVVMTRRRRETDAVASGQDPFVTILTVEQLLVAF